jgi:hypothetical protein
MASPSVSTNATSTPSCDIPLISPIASTDGISVDSSDGMAAFCG